MKKQSYFYQFIEPLSKELAFVARELENSIFTSPRTMLTHARVFVESILQRVIQTEKLSVEPRVNLKESIDLLNEHGLLTTEIRDALHFVRLVGNQAAHDSRMFRYSEALLSWEALYTVVQWFVEVYGPVEIMVPDYQDPSLNLEQPLDITEVEMRLKAVEELLIQSLKKSDVDSVYEETAAALRVESEVPGFTTIRTLTYKDKKLEIPYFLRDAFLLPQRFAKSETFLIRLGAEQQARIMSELPNNLEGLHKYVKRYSEKNEANLFQELKLFIQEEKIRRRLSLERSGELFFFYKSKHIIVTEALSKTPLTESDFTGIPSLLRQLNENDIKYVDQLPKELVILAKYDNVGIGTVEKLFEQLKMKQQV